MKKAIFTLLTVLLFTTSFLAQERSSTAYPLFLDGYSLDSKAGSGVTTPHMSIEAALAVYQNGADRLAALQQNDGGWDWPLDDGDPNDPSAVNTIGPIAMGLAQAYHYTGDPTHLAALTNAGALLLTKTNNFSPSDGYLAAMLDDIFGGTAYVDHVTTNFYDPLAAGTYDKNGAGTLYTTADYVLLVRTNRANQGIANLAAWDLGMGLVGAAMAGANTADWIAGVKAEIDELDGAEYYDVVGLAGAIYGLAIVGEDYDPTAGEHAAANSLADLANILANYQIDMGGFAWNSAYVIPNDANEATQETAYSILALNEFDRDGFLENIEGAGNYLVSVQLVSGGWENYAASGENNEITAEALWGISVSSPELFVDAVTGNDANMGSKASPLATIQAAITGIPIAGQINVADGTYSGNLVINKSLDLIGESEAGVIINILTTGGYGISVASSDVILKNFSLVPNTSNTAYPIHASGTSNLPNGFDNLTLENITIEGVHQRTGFDINGYNNVNLLNLTSKDATGGNGAQVSGCKNVTVNNLTTMNNAWGGFAIYVSKPGQMNRGSDNVTIDFSTNNIDEFIYNEDEFGLVNTNINVLNWTFEINNNYNPGTANFTGYLNKPIADALTFGAGLNAKFANLSSVVIDPAGTTKYVGPGMSIQTAIDAATAGDVIDVAAGTYTEDLAVNKSVTLAGKGPGATIIQPTAPANAAFTVSADNVTIKDIEITETTGLVNGIEAISPASSALRVENVHFTNMATAVGANAYGINIKNSFNDLDVVNCQFISPASATHTRGIGVYAGGGYNLTDFNITGSAFEYLFVGVYFSSAIDGLLVDANTFGPFEIDDCTAAVAGVYIGDGPDNNFDISNATITNNTFVNYGRGIYVWNYGANSAISDFNISGNTFTNSIWSSSIRFILGLNGLENYSISGTNYGVKIDNNDFTQNSGIGANVGLVDFRTYDATLTACDIDITNNNMTFSGGAYSSAMYGIVFVLNGDGFYNTTINGNVIDGGNSGGLGSPVSSAIAMRHTADNNTWTNALDLNISDNQLSAFDAGFSVYNAVSSQYGGLPTGTNVNINNNNLDGNATYGIQYGTGEIINAELNWWGTVVESQIQALFTGNVDYDPWIGKAETLTASGAVPLTLNFPTSGVDITFNTLPVGGGTVTVQRYNEAPSGYPAPPAGSSHAGLWLDITSSMPNYSFSADVTVDVTGLGFDASTSIMYFNSTTNTWVVVNNGTYAAGSPETYTFTTNHFTPFSFINTPATAYNIYLASSPGVAASSVIYPNDAWGSTTYEPNDWNFTTTPIELYIVPEPGSIFGAADIVLQWDNTLFSFVGVDEGGGLFDGIQFQFLYNQLGAVDQVTINASRLDNGNFTTVSGDFICKLQLNVEQPGFGPIDFTAMDFRAFDGAGSFDGVYVVGNSASVKSYLGDVASPGDASTGDGLINGTDLSLWASSYWSGVPGFAGAMTNYKVKYDIGPTADNTVYTLPAQDGKIQFEDLVIFAISYGFSADNVYPKRTPAPETPVELIVGEPMYLGSETLVPVSISGTVVDVRAMELAFGGSFGKLLSVEKGALLQNVDAPVMVMDKSTANSANVDFAIFGVDAEGLNAEGELLTLRFDGRADVQLSSANIRNSGNSPMNIEIINSDVNSVPTSFALDQNYPNPFNPSTIISYQLPEQRQVKVAIFNMLGEEVSTLVNEVKEAGYHKVEWNGANLTSGVYFYRIEAGDFVSVKKMMLMK